MAKIVSRGNPIEPVYLNNVGVAAHGWGVISGLAVSQRGAGANMSVDVASGWAWINSTKIIKVSTTNVAITAAHASYARYDLVVINSSGTISVIDGTVAATSYANDYDLETNNAILLAEVYVPATDTTIEDAQITDKRIIVAIEELENPIFGACIEEYSNHNGDVDNFMETTTTGNATATEDTTNHEMDLSSGITVNGYAAYTSKDSWAPSSKIMVFNGIIQNITLGAGGQRRFKIGFDTPGNWSPSSLYEQAVFFYDSTDGWKTSTILSSATKNTISALSNGDLVTIILTTSYAIFMVNGTVVQTHTTNLPTSALEIGISCGTFLGAAATTSMAVSADYLSIKRHN